MMVNVNQVLKQVKSNQRKNLSSSKKKSSSRPRDDFDSDDDGYERDDRVEAKDHHGLNIMV